MADVKLGNLTFEGVDKVKLNTPDNGTVVFTLDGGNADALMVAMASGEPYELNSNAVSIVGGYAFMGNEQLQAVNFPNAKIIGDNAFRRCVGLRTVSFDSATEIGNSAFMQCNKLENAMFPVVSVICQEAFGITDNLKTVNFPCVTQIRTSAFNNSGLEKADFAVLESIADGAFYNCTNLTAVIIRTTSTVCVANLTAFNETPMLTGEGHIYVPASMYEYYRAGYAPSLAEGFFDILFRKIEDYPEICG